MNRTQMADIIVARLDADQEALRRSWIASAPINHFTVDDLLPPEIANRIRAAYPPGDSMKIKRSLRELKFIAAQMNEYDALLEEAIFAFQDPRIVELVGRITGLQALEPDEQLYAGGISMMVKGHFLNPHVDNSHDKTRERYRVLNLLYYVSPGWSREKGGNLELWPDGPQGQQITVESRFNRLAVMVTNKSSWHSVSEVQVPESRCCVSNYYFSQVSPETTEYFHVTSFRGRPEQKMRDLILRADIALRMGLRKLFPKGVVENKHFYDKK
jgi:Rps23 Pro-64 3,4-dihydroxylase Tpa1-like proline 4-hydroxylase